MSKKRLSRREFLNFASKLGITTAIGSLLSFFPEAKMAFAKGSADGGPIPEMPEDMVMTAIEGDKAQKWVATVLKNRETKMLRKSLSSPQYHPVADSAQVTSLAWEGGTQQATVVSISFNHPKGGEAVLLHIILNGVAHSAMAEYADPSDFSNATFYLIEGDKAVAAVSDITPQVLSTCTVENMVQCLGLWGCAGYGLTACITAFILCPWLPPSCVAAYVCTLWCGGAFSKCYCWACGC